MNAEAANQPSPATRPYCRGNTIDEIRRDIEEKLFCMVGKFPEVATRNNYYLAVAYAVRDRLLYNWVRTARTYFEKASRTAVYFSAEFLIGPQLGRNLVNLGIFDQTAEALRSLGQNLDDLLEQEEEPGLGNGGLGRLAACYMESMATLEIPTLGYGIFSTRRSRTAGRSRKATAGCGWAIRGRSPIRRFHFRSSWGATPNPTPTSRVATACGGCRTAWCWALRATR
jgi:hypothetical protein